MTYPTPPFTFNSEDHELFAVGINDFDSPEDVATMIRYTDWSRFRTFQASDVAAILRRGQVMPLNAVDRRRASRHLQRLHDAYLAAAGDERNFADHKILTPKACNYILCGFLRTNATTAEIADVVNAQSLMPAPLNKLDAHMVEKICDYLATKCPEKTEEWKLMMTQDPEGRRIVEKYQALLYRGADHQIEFLLVPRKTQ